MQLIKEKFVIFCFLVFFFMLNFRVFVASVFCSVGTKQSMGSLAGEMGAGDSDLRESSNVSITELPN